MNSLLKSVHSMNSRKRDFLVRESLQHQLNTSVIEVQGAEGDPIGNCEESMTLCASIEAIFLHGLKDSLLNRVTEALSGPDFDAIPQPSFWGPLLVFSHRGIIDQIQGFSQLNTEVGYCRAWIRLALNEGLLSSYLNAIRRDNKALNPYYSRTAFIRDSDSVKVAERQLETIGHLRFDLACNSSLLNIWSTTPLLMAAIWSPPIKSCPVTSAIDIAKTISSSEPYDDRFDEIETASSIGSLGSFNSSQLTLNNIPCLTEDEALRIILAKDQKSKPVSEPSPLVLSSSPRSTVKKDDIERKAPSEIEQISQTMQTVPEQKDADTSCDNLPPVADVLQESTTEEVQNQDTSGNMGNSLIGRLGWSSSFEDLEASSPVAPPHSLGDAPSYDALIKSYHNAGNTASRTSVDDIEVIATTFKRNQVPRDDQNKVKDVKITIDYEDILGRIPQEKGLDEQNYSCFECSHAIGMTFSKAHVCSFSKLYYCAACMYAEKCLIPSRVIHNWDLKSYPVCQKAALYLKQNEATALLDLKKLNPRIYSVVEDMAQLQSLRLQLNLLRAYLFTCREPVIDALLKQVAPKIYLIEHIHSYSIVDLYDIRTGVLVQHLQRVVEFARNHVFNCWLCCQKGFICEICNDPKVIYPFEIGTTYRCEACHAVFHATCLNSSKPCPKCDRRRKRLDVAPTLELANCELTDEPSDLTMQSVGDSSDLC